MSKQLLHTYRSNVAIAALNDRAYAIIKDDSNSSTLALELLVAKRDDGEDDKQKDQKPEKKKKNPKRKTQEASNPLEIQAVCSTEIVVDESSRGSIVWLAVSREDKTLSLYSVPQTMATTTKSLYPAVTYNLPRRARCLAFCGVSGLKNCPVIVAGDMSGDAIAFPVPSSAPAAVADADADADRDKNTTAATTTIRRLLLGHTASILTGLNVVPTTAAWGEDPQRQLVLTADRDEKVRVSFFPETHIVHGYLLGHSSFISTMDAVVDVDPPGPDGDGGRALCITGSGDGTVRLWDYQSCKEVGMVPVVITKSDKGEEKMAPEEASDEEEKATEEKEEEEKQGAEEGGDAKEEFDDDDLTDDEQSFDCHAVAIPLSVALGPKARHVVVARDGIPSVDIHPIPPPPSKSSTSPSTSSLLLSHLVSLHEKQTMECPSQPLAVRCLSDGSVLVLTREPDYLLHFQSSKEGSTAEFEDVSSASPFRTALEAAVKDQNIVMPVTTLEQDEDGECKLQKKRVNYNGDPDGNGGSNEGEGRTGPHWNDAKRRETAKLADQRRRKRRRDEALKGEVGNDKS